MRKTRSERRPRLTAAGGSFLPYVERALAALEEGRRAVADHQTGWRGRVSMVALDSLAVSWLPEPVQRFRRELPAVDVAVHLCMPREILNLLYEGVAELGLMRGPLWERGIEVLARFQEPLLAIASKDHPLPRREGLSLPDLMDYPVYRIPLDAASNAFVEHFSAQRSPRASDSQVLIPAILAIPMLLKGPGIAFLPERFVRDALQKGELVSLQVVDLPALSQQALLVKRADRNLEAPQLAFVRMFKAQWRPYLFPSTGR